MDESPSRRITAQSPPNATIEFHADWKASLPAVMSLEDGLRMLTYFQIEEWKALEVFGHHLNVAAGFLATAVGGGIIFASTADPEFAVVSAAAPILVTSLAWLTARSLDRYYKRFLEAVVASRKLRFAIGFGGNEPPYPHDEYLEVGRRWPGSDKGSGSHGGLEESDQWVDRYMTEGHNRIARQLLALVCALSSVAPLIYLMRAHGPNPLGFYFTASAIDFGYLIACWSLALGPLSVAANSIYLWLCRWDARAPERSLGPSATVSSSETE